MKGLLDTVEALPASKPLFMAQSKVITVGQIRKTATAICAGLSRPGPLFLHTASAAAFVAGLLAASRKGFSVRFPAHLQARYLHEIGADLGTVMTDQAIESTSALPIVLCDDEEAATSDRTSPDLDLIFYTSGVTGTPKKVLKKISQLESEALVLDELWGARAGQTIATVSHQHIYGMLFRIFWPVLSGRLSQDRATDYWEILFGMLSAETTLVTSPAHLTRLPENIGISSIPDLIFSAGAPLSLAAAQNALQRLGTVPIEVLGSTETGGIGWRQQRGENTLWTPLPGVRVCAGEGSILQVRSPFVSGDGPVATGDSVECVGEHFRLNGRADRIVKIDGKRVSLGRVEAALIAQIFIEAAAAIDLPSRKGALGAIVTLTAEGEAALVQHGAFRLTRSLRIALAPLLEPAERPKHWRFAPIPVNAQGKPLQSMLRACFEKHMPGEGRIISQQGSVAEIELSLPPSLVWFQGHFPGQPVLPGIAQVHLAAQWAECLWDWRPDGANLSQLKFRQIIRPGDTVRLKLTRDATDRRLSFAYQMDDVVASQGIIGGHA